MLPFVVKRLLALIPVLLGISVVTFILVLLIPGNPVDALLPPDTPASIRAEYKKELHLDDSVDQRFAAWLGHVVTGDFGESVQQRIPAGTVMARALGNTVQLAAAGMVIAGVVGVLLGMAMAWWADRRGARALNAVVIGSASVPQFWFGLVLLFVFSAKLQILPSGGMGPLIGGDGLGTRLQYLLLPAITVAILPMAIIARLSRSLFLELRGQDFILAMRTRGYSTPRIWRHLLRNAAPGIVNITGLQAGYCILGTIFAEIVFSWPGIGRALTDAVGSRDYPVIQAIVLVTGAIFAAITIVVDLAMRMLDPRLEGA